MVIKSSIFPLRISLKKKEPWELIIDIENEDPKVKKVLVEIYLPEVATFSTVGSSRTYEKKYDAFKANDKITIKMPIYLSNYANEGSHFGKIKVSEHFGDYGYVERSFSKDIPFRVVG